MVIIISRQREIITGFSIRSMIVVPSHLSYEPLWFKQCFRSGVGNLRPAGRMWPSQSFYAARHIIWELTNTRTMQEGQRRTLIQKYSL
jgi:hypothetical protein